MEELIECYGTEDDSEDTVLDSEVTVLDSEVTVLDSEVTFPDNDGLGIIPHTLQTEDTGKMFEMAICLAYGITYDGKYKYGMELPNQLRTRLEPISSIYPNLQHTAKRGARYDFTSITDPTKHLSAKTTKKGIGKVAPQVIGQCQPHKFCDILGIQSTTIPSLKEYIQTHIPEILKVLVEHTFDCPNLYYNQEKDSIQYITWTTDIFSIDWENFPMKWTRKWDEWENSSTLKTVYEGKEYALVEFQFHTKNRTNMAIRWYYENVITIFRKNMHIIHL